MNATTLPLPDYAWLADLAYNAGHCVAGVGLWFLIVWLICDTASGFYIDYRNYKAQENDDDD